MDVNVYVRFGKEIDEQTKTIIASIFESKNMQINSGEFSGNDRLGFIIRNNVADVELFTENVYKTLQQVPCLFLVAPQKCLDKLKHHPRVHCFDCKVLEDPASGIDELIDYAYYGKPC